MDAVLKVALLLDFVFFEGKMVGSKKRVELSLGYLTKNGFLKKVYKTRSSKVYMVEMLA